MLKRNHRNIGVALLLLGSATLLFSCGEEEAAKSVSHETLMTEYGEEVTITKSENGQRAYVFQAPLFESYSLARTPYQEFREGIELVSYRRDTVDAVDVRLTANYAIYYPEKDLWEAKGNVVVRKFNGQEVYTQQLFWNAQTHRIYSNVDTRIVQEAGRGDMVVEGFESDDALVQPKFRRIKGRMLVNIEPTQPSDSVKQEAATDREPNRPTTPPDRTPVRRDATRPSFDDRTPQERPMVTPSQRKEIRRPKTRDIANQQLQQQEQKRRQSEE